MSSINVGRLIVAVSAYDSCQALRKQLEEKERELGHALAKLMEGERVEYEKHVRNEVDIVALLTNGTFRRRGE